MRIPGLLSHLCRTIAIRSELSGRRTLHSTCESARSSRKENSMKINAVLDVNVVAHEAADEVAVLLEMEAPAAPADVTRPQASLQVVLDRSGSMNGAPLEGAKKALIALIRRLEPTDNFGLVTFDDSAQVVVPAGQLTDKQAVIAQIAAVQAGGTTDLSAGYIRGLREIRRVATAGGTVLVVSDGHVNAGIRDADEFASLTAAAYNNRIVTSTLGYGRGYDETLLSAIARSGSGNHVFANDPDAAGAAIAGEVDGLLNKVIQALSLTIAFEPAVEFLRLYNDLPAAQIGDRRVMVELGDLYAEEARKVLLKFKVRPWRVWASPGSPRWSWPTSSFRDLLSRSWLCRSRSTLSPATRPPVGFHTRLCTLSSCSRRPRTPSGRHPRHSSAGSSRKGSGCWARRRHG